MDAEGRVRDRLLWTDGAAARVAAPLRQIVMRALLCDAAAVVIGHNHPSGNPAPSAEDVALTRKLARLLESLDIQLADHIIVAASGSYRFRDAGLL